MMRPLLISAVLFVALTRSAIPQESRSPFMQIEAKIPLGNVMGRIDHMAVDLDRQRLFVAELGNNSVGVVDLGAHTLLQRIPDLHEPQGVAYSKTADMLYVSNAGDGSV